jgi:RimJ/RimL family protein N-acetyltransferase
MSLQYGNLLTWPQLNIIPAWQRTFVQTHASGILLKYMLSGPSEGGLNIRRMQWFANAANERSQAAAKRLGFQFEGILRWHRVLPPEKVGAERDDGRGKARHSALLSLCWDDWQREAQEKLRVLMER